MLLEGKKHQDERGIITFNNDFVASQIKSIYTIENHSTDFIRGWQGHKVEQRWFACMKGSFEISVIAVDNFTNPSKDLTIQKYLLKDDALTYLRIPAGYITAIRARNGKSKLLVLADHEMGEISDEYRYSLDYFNNI
ncbi:WxcM-like domain-containing protein [Chryseobacterium wangxinyae]|uniref:WxcM-like domain-containing protein n=1 Tax=Chryseobacterium sp. CY350 TaxID=2997336 RepID=UPI002271CB5E|nr:WxcM-like domain-containing protein [Chryseobacterium sp. CY350]MCY0979379.1 WxcM-like domain-containing protein [Chryseobacterium sp. CY350]WBZ97125.1 WxcM-like domain-containing protein [Chryseobacterium sp. CY350]